MSSRVLPKFSIWRTSAARRANCQHNRASEVGYRLLVTTSIFIAALGGEVANTARAAAPGGSETSPDILCEHAPKRDVLQLPALVADWVTIICTPTGQALAPELRAKGIWVTASTGTPFIVEAAPRDFQRPAAVTSYDLRFSNFAAGEREGAAKEMTLNLFDAAFRIKPRPNIDRVVQLDARSVWQGTIFNLFFFVTNDQLRWLIVCTERCAKAVPLNVVYQLNH